MVEQCIDVKCVTEWDDPEEIIQSEYGNITYRLWCEIERDRLNKRGDTVRIITNSKGQICLTR